MIPPPQLTSLLYRTIVVPLISQTKVNRSQPRIHRHVPLPYLQSLMMPGLFTSSKRMSLIKSKGNQCACRTVEKAIESRHDGRHSASMIRIPKPASLTQEEEHKIDEDICKQREGSSNCLKRGRGAVREQAMTGLASPNEKLYVIPREVQRLAF